MADIRDEHGNPIQLTDEQGRPVQLTDEHGDPVHLTGVATTVGSGPHSETTKTTTGSEMHGGTHFAHTPTDSAKRGAEAVVGAGGSAVGAVTGVGKAATHAVTGGGGAPASHTHDAGVEGEKKELERSTSSSSSSSEDDGQGGRRKKKGLMAKIKEKLPGRKDKDKDREEINQEHEQQQQQQAAHSFTTKVSSTTEPGQPHQPENIRVEHHEQEHQKKGGFIDKIKEKLPGHHS